MDQLYNAISVLQEISSAVVHERNSTRLLDSILDTLSRKMGMLRATFTLRQGDVFQIEASHGLDDSEKKRGRYRLGEGITGRVAASGEPLLIADISKDERFLNRTQSHKANEHVAFLCVPVVHMERIIGTLSIERQVAPDVALDADMKLLQTIGNLAADAIAILKQEHEERETLLAENRRLRDSIESGSDHPGELIGNCGSMRQVYQLIEQVAPSDATVLIRGSSGTGKELVAVAIQQLSTRKDKPFITLNCAALPEALVESELFGHEKGAFTGAQTRRIGRVEAANKGTLFLDEIGDLNLQSQVKLLRFIQERTFSRVGSNDEQKADVRIIAATSRDLEALMRDGKFREDLYYRLNVFPILVPDLARRKCDIVLLAEHFIEKYNLRHGKKIKRISPPAVNMFMAYQWPGNVRELENCVERAVLTSTDDAIHSYNLPPSLQTTETHRGELLAEGRTDFNTLVDEFERELITEALKKNNGNMSAAARDLNLSPRVIHYKINRLKIQPEWYQ